VLEYIFAALFFIIRVVGGTVVTLSWYLDMIPRLIAGRGHSHFTIVCCLVLIAVVMVLQYVWFWEIVKIATGRGDPPAVVTSPEKKNDDVKDAAPAHSTGSTTTTRRRAHQ
jgi:hypothetical protein